MKKTNDSFFKESPAPKATLSHFSNNRRLSNREWFLLRLACLTPTSAREPLALSRIRSRIENAERAREHLLALNLEPIFDSFEAEALYLNGLKK